MALATLCRDLSTVQPGLGLHFKALIVDHSARKESAFEASKIASILQNMGKGFPWVSGIRAKASD